MNVVEMVPVVEQASTVEQEVVWQIVVVLELTTVGVHFAAQLVAV